jgi:2-methylcitrate dehydratase PrpD
MDSTEQRYGNGATMQLARWIAGLTYQDLPERTRDVVRLVLLDTLGCGIYGYATPWTQAILQWVKAGGAAKGRARAWNSASVGLRAADAALVNGVSAHAFELDDYHNTKLHPGAVVIPAVLAMAEERNLAGDRLVTAIAAGYEVMIRSSMALDPSAARLRGWHLTGACGPFGAAAACAVLLGLDTERTAWALGLAGTQGAGLWAFNADGAMSKRLHAGKAAHAGVFAAELAAGGFTGPTQIYEFNDGGFLKAFSDQSSVAPLTKALGRTWHLDQVSIKPYSCCASTHAYIDAALELRRRAGNRWDASRPVRVGLSKVVDVQCGFDYKPGTALNAQMSVRYCVAAALMDGQVLPAQFSEQRMQDPALALLAGKLQLEPDPALDKLYPAHFSGWVSAKTEGDDGAGDWMRVDILDPSGSAAAPVDWNGVVRKFKANCATAPVDHIAEMVTHIERHSARELMDLLGRDQTRRAAA